MFIYFITKVVWSRRDYLVVSLDLNFDTSRSIRCPETRVLALPRNSGENIIGLCSYQGA